MTIHEIIEEINRSHFPNTPAAIEDIEKFEASTGYSLPSDMKSFYLAFNGASLFRKDNVPPFTIVPIDELQTASNAIFGPEDPDRNDSCFAFCDRGDGDYVGIDLRESDGEFRRIIDCWHEAYPDSENCPVIANSFRDFMTKALNSGGNSYFWGPSD